MQSVESKDSCPEAEVRIKRFHLEMKIVKKLQEIIDSCEKMMDSAAEL